MKKSHLVIALSIIVITVCAIAVAGRNQFGSLLSLNSAPDRTTAAQTNQEGRLRREARRKGHHVETWEDPQWKQRLNVKTLVKKSSLVVVGKATRALCTLSADGSQLTIDYQLIVDDVFKGSATAGSVLPVSLPGGLMRFEDGTLAEVRTPAFRKMVAGKKYVLFLSADSNGRTVLVPTGGPQGLFEISMDGTKATHFTGDLTSPPAPAQDLRSLMEEIRDAVKK